MCRHWLPQDKQLYAGEAGTIAPQSYTCGSGSSGIVGGSSGSTTTVTNELQISAAVSDAAPEVAVTVTLPTLIPVARPLTSIVATSPSSVSHVTGSSSISTLY